MASDSVFRVLQEVFPQVDHRMLRAVAYEHPKDVDKAVEVVLEVIPCISSNSLAANSSSKSNSSLGDSEDCGQTGQFKATVDPVDVIQYLPEQSTESGPSSNDGSLSGATEDLDAGSSVQPNIPTVVEPVILEPLDKSSYHDANGETDTDTEMVISPAGNQLLGNCETDVAFTQESDPSSSKTMSEKDDFGIEIVNPDYESTMISMLNMSDQNCSTELLEEVIEDAKNNKKSLVLAMNSVVDLMREVESKEKAAEEAKEEATRGCSDILAKVDELEQTLRRAKEANDMHAGEVHAEKAILATEFKELQFRLYTLSDERNKSLGILDEMRKGLEIRLAAAIEQIMAAEDEKLEKVNSAKEALLYQESQMEKVVQESKKLKLEAEENSKLQEFLMDRGRAIDILQGEISVTYQDVLLLKEKFDKRIPLSRSLSSSQTSSILASSSSSFRSIVTPIESKPEPEPEPEPETYGTLMKSAELSDSCGSLDKSLRSEVTRSSPRSPVYSVDDHFPSGKEKEKEKQIDDRKALLDDGWELFDNLEA